MKHVSNFFHNLAFDQRKKMQRCMINSTIIRFYAGVYVYSHMPFMCADPEVGLWERFDNCSCSETLIKIFHKLCGTVSGANIRVLLLTYKKRILSDSYSNCASFKHFFAGKMQIWNAKRFKTLVRNHFSNQCSK